MRRTLTSGISCLILASVGCASMAVEARTSQIQKRRTAIPPLAVIDGYQLKLEEFAPALIEAGGSDVLAEAILLRVVNDRLGQGGVEINQEQIETERKIILQSLSRNPDEAEKLLGQLRRERHLGPQRFSTLLKVNAALRQFVRDEVSVTDAEIRLAFDRVYGPTFEARLIIVATAREAASIADQVLNGESFINLAINHSTDSSRVVGGLLPPINLLDASFPKAVRDVLTELEPGQISRPILLARGFGILRLERKIDGGVETFDDVKNELQQWLFHRGEKIEMAKLAKQMLAEADVVIFDRTLHRIWRQYVSENLILQSQ